MDKPDYLTDRQGPVVYCAFEGQARLRNRVEAFRRRKLSEDAGDAFYLVAASMNLVADHSALIASAKQRTCAQNIITEAYRRGVRPGREAA